MIPMATTVWSTTHTAPIIFDRISPEKMFIILEDGSRQEYWTADLLEACKIETQQNHTGAPE